MKENTVNPTPFVTVIVPIYNVAQYVEKCARSLFEQTLDNLEILFIDDCSPDNSVEIIRRTLKEYPKRRSLTRIIKMSSNTGQAGVRRQGIIEATGNYIIHLDGDDWVDLDLYQRMYDVAQYTKADIVVCGFAYENNGHTELNVPAFNSDNPQILLSKWYSRTIHMSCTNKLVKRSLLIDNDVLPWPGLNMWEDNGLFARIFYYANKIITVHGPVYHYNRCNAGAMTASYGEAQVNQMISIAEHLADFFQSKPDAADYEKTVSAFKYLAKLNLITDSFAGLRRFRSTYPESDYIAAELDRGAFSPRGRFRFHMVRLGLAPLFILMFKAYKLLKLR